MMAFAPEIGYELNLKLVSDGSITFFPSTIAGSGVKVGLDDWHKGEDIYRPGFR